MSLSRSGSINSSGFQGIKHAQAGRNLVERGPSPATQVSGGTLNKANANTVAGGGMGGGGAMCAAPCGWWMIILIVCSFQLFLLYRWSVVSTMVIADHRLLYRKARDVSMIQEVVEERVLPQTKGMAADPEKLLRALVANITQRFESREVELVTLGFKLLEREKELARLQSSLIDAVTQSGARVGLLDDGETREFVSEGRNGATAAGGGAAVTRRGAAEVSDQKGGRQAAAAAVAAVPPGGGGAPCGRQQDTGRRGRVVWRPAPGRYLLAMCSGGQLSNRISCVRQHMLDAALLNRTLVFPSHGIDYNYNNLLDLESPKLCFGDDAFITMDEFVERVKPPKHRGRGRAPIMVVDMYVCHVHTYQTDKICGIVTQKYENLGIRFAKPFVPDVKTPSPWFKYKSADFVRAFNFPDATVVAFGNMFGVGGSDFRFRGSQPLAVSGKCKYYLLPSKPIISVASGFVNSFLGSTYLALHLRRGDFYDHCVIKQNSRVPCFQPIQQVASCIEKRLAQNPDTRMVYLSTNGDELEVQVLKELLGSKIAGGVSIVRLPALVSQQWAEPLVALKLHKEPEVVSFIEKMVCVMSAVFYGTPGSTYTGDINRLRDWLLTRSCSDGSICEETDVVDMGRILTR